MAKHADIEGYYFDGHVTKAKMKGLAYFAEAFAEPDFELGCFQAMPVTSNGPKNPAFILSETANDFVTYLINEKLIEPRCGDRAEWNWGKIAMSGNMAAEADPYDLMEMLTYIVGNHVHWRSRLVKAYQNGLLNGILNRAAQLAALQKEQPAQPQRD